MSLKHGALGCPRPSQVAPVELDLERFLDHSSRTITDQRSTVEHGFNPLWSGRLQYVGNDRRLHQQHPPWGQVNAQAGQGTA